MINYPPAPVPFSSSVPVVSAPEVEADKSIIRAMIKKNYNVVAGFETKY